MPEDNSLKMALIYDDEREDPKARVRILMVLSQGADGEDEVLDLGSAEECASFTIAVGSMVELATLVQKEIEESGADPRQILEAHQARMRARFN